MNKNFFKALVASKNDLETLKANSVDQSVIAAVEKQIAQIERKLSRYTLPDEFKVRAEVNGQVGIYSIYTTEIQRDLDMNRVSEFYSLFKNGHYESAFPILTITVAKANELGLRLYDFYGNDITDTADENALVIIEGQHRGVASALLYSEGSGFCLMNICNKPLITDLAQYLSTINGKEISTYSDGDRIDILASRDSDSDDLIVAINNAQNDGFNLSTIERAYCNGSTIPKDKYNKAFVSGDTLTSMLTERESEKIDLSRGQRILQGFINVGYDTKKVSRYWVEGFYSYAAAHSEERAFQALSALTNEMITTKITSGTDFIALLNTAYSNSIG
jgi:hypothetical protein